MHTGTVYQRCKLMMLHGDGVYWISCGGAGEFVKPVNQCVLAR